MNASVKWQPLETAPRDTPVIVGRPGSIMIIAMCEADGLGGMEWYDICGSDLRGITHWHPLPGPPGQEEECK